MPARLCPPGYSLPHGLPPLGAGEALYNQRRAEGLWRGMSLLKEAHNNGKSNKLEGVTVA